MFGSQYDALMWEHIQQEQLADWNRFMSEMPAMDDPMGQWGSSVEDVVTDDAYIDGEGMVVGVGDAQYDDQIVSLVDTGAHRSVDSFNPSEPFPQPMTQQDTPVSPSPMPSWEPSQPMPASGSRMASVAESSPRRSHQVPQGTQGVVDRQTPDVASPEQNRSESQSQGATHASAETGNPMNPGGGPRSGSSQPTESAVASQPDSQSGEGRRPYAPNTPIPDLNSLL